MWTDDSLRQFRVLRERHRWLGSFSALLGASGYFEAAVASYFTAQRVYDEAETLYDEITRD